MSEHRCRECQHYMQHYTINSKRIFRVCCGHCSFPSQKRKRPEGKACEHFSPGSPQEEAFVSKEYLSKELLQYMMKLELLPDIEDLEKHIR